MEVFVRSSGAVLADAKILGEGTFSSVNIVVTRQAGSDRGGKPCTTACLAWCETWFKP